MCWRLAVGLLWFRVSEFLQARVDFSPSGPDPPLSGIIFVLHMRGFQAGLALSEPHDLCKLERVFSDPLSYCIFPIR